MATQTILFQGSAQIGEQRISYIVQVNTRSEDDAGVMDVETQVEMAEGLDAERYTSTVHARFENPTLLAMATTALGAVALCVVARWTGALMEALYKAADQTKPKGQSSWRSMEERADAIAKHLIQHRKDSPSVS